MFRDDADLGSAALYHSLLEASDEGVMVIERAPPRADGLRDWRFVAMNARAGAMFGKPDLTGQTAREHFPLEDEAWYDLFDRVLETGVAERIERESVPQAMVIEMFVTRVETRATRMLLVVMQDATARRRAAGALERSQRRHAFLLELSDSMRPLADAHQIMTAACTGLGQFLGVGRCGYGEVDGAGSTLQVECEWTDGVAPALRGAHRIADLGEAVVEALRSGTNVLIEDAANDPRTRRARAGEPAWPMRASLAVPLVKGRRWVAVLYAQQAVPRRWTREEESLVRGVAERTWAALERAHAEAELREADRRKDEFLATLAHELRNPLAPISTALKVLRTGPSAENAAQLQAIIERQVEHMVRLVDDLLDVSRISRGAIVLQHERLDLRNVLQAALETSRPAIERGRHTITVELPEDPLDVEGDPVRLAQVFANLLNNAARYSDDGGRIVVTARREGLRAAVGVRDRGIGIPADELARVFELFTQADPESARARGGLGIGLNLARRLVEMHGGALEAESDGVGQGSTFTVRLPLLGRAAAIAPRPAAPVVSDLSDCRVLVVDDNCDAAETLALLLGQCGATARFANDGNAALEVLQDWRPTAVLLDLGMPGMNGFEVARRIRGDSRLAQVRLVALTGWGQDEDRRRTREAGFDHHLTKPVTLDGLVSTLRAVC